MVTVIDKFGRIVIPQNIRKDLGLAPGVRVGIEEHEDQVIIKRVESGNSLSSREGVLIFKGEATGDLEDAVGSLRKTRLKDTRL